MDIAQQASSLLFPDFRFGSTEPESAERLVDLSVGGFCLYGGTAREVFDLTTRLQKRATVPLLFCADYEDGAGSHVTGATRFPSNMAIAAAASEGLAREKGRLTAIEARALGVDWVLAPVVDLATRPENPIVNLRSFGAKPQTVIRMASAYLRGLKAGGALPCLKHFPGHGDTDQDSHLVLPDLNVPLQVLMKRELEPFIALKEAAGSLMAAHLRVKALDREYPASLSNNVLKGFLREKLGFGGLLATDALSMNAIRGAYTDEEQAALALGAGVDVLLVPEDPFKFHKALMSLVGSSPERHRSVMVSSKRLLRVKRSLGLFQTVGKPDPGLLRWVGHPKHREAAERMAKAALTWVCRPGTFLEAGQALSYLEPENEADRWEGKEFVAALRRSGFRVYPFQEGKRADTVVIGVFSRPRAYSGKIGLSVEQDSRASQAMKSAGRAYVVCFGTPFAARSFSGAEGILCTFSNLEISQKAAVRALLGDLRATGKLPVALNQGQGASA